MLTPIEGSPSEADWTGGARERSLGVMEEMSGDTSLAAAPRRLTALDDALAALLSCARAAMVAPRDLSLAEAARHPDAALAEALVAPSPLPPVAQARRDGWAVAALDTLGASPHAPAPLPLTPHRVAPGDAMPAGTDAVLGPFDIQEEFGIAHAIRGLAQGEGTRGRGEDIAAGATLRAAGDGLKPADLAALSAWGIAMVRLRIARIAWIPVGDEILTEPARDRAGPFLAGLAARDGAAFSVLAPVPDRPAAIADALRAAAAAHDLLLLGGGTGEGPDDRSAAGLAAAGRLIVHGIGMRPGASAGFGVAGGRPALLVPGSPEDALATWILLARPALDAMTGARARPTRRVRLARKLASSVGIAELAALAIDAAGEATPLATGELPLASLAAADGFALVPAAAEGYEAGSTLALATP